MSVFRITIIGKIKKYLCYVIFTCLRFQTFNYGLATLNIILLPRVLAQYDPYSAPYFLAHFISRVHFCVYPFIEPFIFLPK